jgi:hypothetical protein
VALLGLASPAPGHWPPPASANAYAYLPAIPLARVAKRCQSRYLGRLRSKGPQHPKNRFALAHAVCNGGKKESLQNNSKKRKGDNFDKKGEILKSTTYFFRNNS